MSKNLQKMMAAKYPAQNSTIMRDADVVSPQKQCVLTPKKMFCVAIILSGLFFVLALPHTFKLVGDLLPGINRGTTHDNKLVFLHALVFAVVSFFFLYNMC